MLSQIRFQAILVALIPLTVLAAILAYALATRGTTADTAYWSQHTQRVLSQSDALMESFSDANRAVFGYERWHDTRDMAQFYAAMKDIEPRIAALDALTAGYPQERRVARGLSAVIERADRFLLRYTRFERAGNTAQLRVMATAKSTQALAAGLVDAKRNLDAYEHRLALRKLDAFSTSLSWFSNVLLVALIGGIALYLAAAAALTVHLARRSSRLRSNAEALLRGESPPALRGNDELAWADREYRSVFVRLREEHNNAALLQRALLPQNLPSIPGVRIDASYAPSASGSDVGGDWYDVFPLGDGRLGISVGDVAGHGLQAASRMALMRQSVRMAARLCDGPAEVLQVVNRVAYEDGSPLLTIFYGELALTDGLMRYAVAGHPMPITVRASGIVEQLQGEGLIIGADRRVEYREYSIVLDAGTALVLFTDGLIEDGRKAGRDYSAGVERLLDVVNRQYYSAAENIAYAIQRDVLEGRPPIDDAAVLFIGVTDLGAARSAATKTWTIDARMSSAARRAKRAFLWHLGEFAADGADLSESELIFGELVGNVARHTAGTAEISLEILGKRAFLHVCDRGAPIVHDAHQPEEFAESGRGLLLVKNLAKHVEIARTQVGNRITAELPITLERADVAVVTPRRTHRRRTAHA
jgi:anti-sigma regulatory factor (Ser/Thr protein kinase)/CHASE3 domain sensor protein